MCIGITSICTCGMAASRAGMPERCSCVSMRIWIGADSCSGISGVSSLVQTTSNSWKGAWVYTSSSLFVVRAVAHVPFSSYDSRWTSLLAHELSRGPHAHPALFPATPGRQEREEHDVMCWEKVPPFREDSVKLFESALSLVCYHCCRG